MFASEAMAELQRAVPELIATPWDQADRDTLLHALQTVETARRQLAALDHVLLAALRDRNVASELGAASLVSLLVQLLRVTPAEARARVGASELLGPRRELTGAPLDPIFAPTAAAQRAGTISAAHSRVITTTVTDLPDELERQHGAAVEQTLLEHAAAMDPATLHKVGARIVAHLNPDGVEPTDRERQRRRSLQLRTRNDGCGELTGRLTPAALATWRSILDALAAPAAQDGEPDTRRPEQRAHDAFLDAGQRLLRSGDLPDTGGTPVTILVTVTPDQLTSGSGYATTSHGDLISVPELLQLADEAEVAAVRQDSHGGVLDYGRSRRLATAQQRRALAARDRGCSFPGCTRPPAWTQAHHITAWADGGETNLANLTLLCGHHHREHAKRGWTCRVVNGAPHWLPPPWLDPDQRPRRNTAHVHAPPV